MTSFNWSPENVERLKAMASESGTGSEIAAALGTTRISVLGKCMRLGIKLSRVAIAVTPRPSRIPAVRMAKPKKKPASIIPFPWPAPVQPAQIEPVQQQSGVRFIDAKDRQCRMILDADISIERRMVCGAKTDIGKAWCPDCYRIVYHPIQRRA